MFVHLSGDGEFEACSNVTVTYNQGLSMKNWLYSLVRMDGIISPRSIRVTIGNHGHLGVNVMLSTEYFMLPCVCVWMSNSSKRWDWLTSCVLEEAR